MYPAKISLKIVAKHLRRKQIISSNCEEMLNQIFWGIMGSDEENYLR